MMMRRTPRLPLRFALAALAIALTGCPNPAVDTSDKDPKTNPQAEEPDAGKAPTEPMIHTLGLVAARIVEARYESGKPFYRLNPPLGYLRAKGAAVPGLSMFLYKPRPDGPAGAYVSAGIDDYTHSFQAAPLAANVAALEISLGGEGASQRDVDGSTLRVSFPAGAQGDLLLTAKPESGLSFKRESYSPSQTTFEAAYVLPASSLAYYSAHDATASLTVAVAELNGDPCVGLAAANFRLVADYLPGVIGETRETAKGTYQVIATFRELSGEKAQPRNLALEIVNPPVREEVKP